MASLAPIGGEGRVRGRRNTKISNSQFSIFNVPGQPRNTPNTRNEKEEQNPKSSSAYFAYFAVGLESPENHGEIRASSRRLVPLRRAAGSPFPLLPPVKLSRTRCIKVNRRQQRERRTVRRSVHDVVKGSRGIGREVCGPCGQRAKSGGQRVYSKCANIGTAPCSSHLTS